MISKTAEYALRLVVCLTSYPSQPKSADFLSKKTQVPRSYLHRVLQDLAASGLVQSRPGPGGGYELARESDHITLLDVVNAVSPIERIRKCPLGLVSHTTLCPLHQRLDEAFAETEKAFRGVTLHDLLESTSPVMPLCDIALAVPRNQADKPE
jgi:Rrf2 family protein